MMTDPHNDTPLSLTDFAGQVVLVGAGQMGGALMRGWLKHGLSPQRITISDPRPPANIQAVIDANGIACNPTRPEPADVLILAVKPQIADEVMTRVTHFVGPRTVIVSVMAGKTAARIEQVFGQGAAVVRTIPNTPAAVGRGITGAFANAHVSGPQRQSVEGLLSAVGRVEWLAPASRPAGTRRRDLNRRRR
jgi:pyrroline-5-carboxylate reductase